jgi:hypothetical protein
MCRCNGEQALVFPGMKVERQNFDDTVPSAHSPQRIDKENALAEKFWAEQALKGLQSSPASVSPKGQGTHYHRAPSSVAASSAAPTGYTSKSAVSGVRAQVEGDSPSSQRGVNLLLTVRPCEFMLQFLMDRLTRLENALEVEKQHRQKVEEELVHLRTQTP